MEEGFIKGSSDNLPRVDSLMVAQYFIGNQEFTAAEIRGIKMKRYVYSKYLSITYSRALSSMLSGKYLFKLKPK